MANFPQDEYDAEMSMSLVLSRKQGDVSRAGTVEASAVVGSSFDVTPPGAVSISIDGKVVATTTPQLLFFWVNALSLAIRGHTVSASYAGSTNSPPVTTSRRLTVT
jgi:hypothetical protein